MQPDLGRTLDKRHLSQGETRVIAIDDAAKQDSRACK